MSFNSRSIGLMRAYLRLGAAAFIVVCALSSVHSIFGQSMPGFQAPGKPKAQDNTPLSVKAARGQAPLSQIYGHLIMDVSKVRHLPALAPSELKKAVNDKVLRIGVVRPLPLPLNPLTDSAAYVVAEGEVNVAAIETEGALYTRVHFKEMSLPAGARVFVYSASKPDEYYGPYEGHGPSGDGTFWTPRLTGDTVVIEYVTALGSKSKGTPFLVSEVSHTFKDAFGPNDPAGSCNNDIVPNFSQWLTLATSVGMLDFIDDETDSEGNRFEVKCTGTLLNDTASDQIPYVLTANHCVDSQTEAQSLIVFWNYLSGEVPPGGAQTTVGSNLLATGTSSDFTLLRLTGSLPGGLFFSGWEANSFGTSPISVSGIHHPNGSHKRISFGSTNTTNCSITGLPGPCANFTGVTWSSGTTEEGSSGSGLWKIDNTNVTNSKLVGTLNGGLASCNNQSGSDYYGRFSETYKNISSFLNSCVTSISPASQSFTNAGGTGSITVNSPGGCGWNVIRTDAFVTITSGSSGTGSGTVTFSVAPNTGWTRTASIIIGSQVFRVTQARSGSAVCTPLPINLGQTINTTLEPTDCALGDGTLLDPYSFNGLAGQQVAISMSSPGFDTYLYLLNPDGSTLTSNDDSNSSSNSRIPVNSGFITLPTTGTYTILANSFEDGATGSYSLTLSGVPLIITEEGSNNSPPGAFAVDSVTFVRGPFRILDEHNFSADQHTRVLLYTSDLGLTTPNPSLLTVQAQGFNLPVENVGPISGVAGLNGSYVVVRLPDGLPTGTLTLTLTYRGQTSNSTTINIIP